MTRVHGNPNGFVRRLEGVCQPLSHASGFLSLGNERAPDGVLGPTSPDIMLQCDPRQMLVGVVGSADQVVDHRHILCATLRTTLSSFYIGP